MIELTPEAQRRVAEYLDEVRESLRACPSVESEDISRDIMEHIEAELADCARPVGPESLAAVLERLGSPRQWVPEEELSWWGKIIHRLHRGPEDWRLAYLAFAVLIPGTLVLGPLGILGSFLLARARIALTPKHEISDAQKWLLYPSLVLVYIPLGLFLLLWPTLLVTASVDHAGLIIASFVVGLWWLILGLFAKRLATSIQRIFRPFADDFEGKLAKKLMVIGAGLTILSALAGVLVLIYTA